MAYVLFVTRLPANNSRIKALASPPQMLGLKVFQDKILQFTFFTCNCETKSQSLLGMVSLAITQLTQHKTSRKSERQVDVHCVRASEY